MSDTTAGAHAAQPLQLRAGAWEMLLLPGGGGTVAALRHDGEDVLRPIPAGADPIKAKAGAFPMLPWCNRLGDGWLRWPGGEHRFPRNNAEDGTAIHGLARMAPWQVVEADGASARLVQNTPDYPADPAQPYRYRAEMRFALDEAGLHLAMEVGNTGDAAMPFGLGWHPWFVRHPDTRVRLRATQALTPGPHNMPEAATPSTGIDGGVEHWIGHDDGYAGWDGVVDIVRPALSLQLQATGAWARNFQFFAPEAREVVCLEPVSHVTDVTNRRALAPFGDMQLLAPGKSMAGALVLRKTG